MTSYTDTLQHGDSIGCYQIEDVLGRGGFAVTYLATDKNLDVQVAIKEYLPSEIIQRDQYNNVSARRPEFAEDYDVGLNSFAREAKTLARFKHPNIVRVHQVIHEHNTAYMVMDYERGEELTELLSHHDHLSEIDLRAIIFPIFDGVEEIHSHGLAHRDIKPSNIYLRDSGSPVLLDFGSARYTMSESTQQLTAVVTVGYTPIEQYNVSDIDQGPWSDIYALAAVLYEAVTGEMPVDSVTRASSTLTSADDPLVSVREKATQPFSDGFLDAIDWGLRMDAKDRPQSIARWRDSFDGVATRKPTQPLDNRSSRKRTARRSKLLTYADAPRASDNGEALPERPQPMIPERESGVGLGQPEALVGTRYRDDSHHSDVESVPLHTDTHDDDTHAMPSFSMDDSSMELRSPMHSNPAHSNQRSRSAHQPYDADPLATNDDLADPYYEQAEEIEPAPVLPPAAAVKGTTHTQEIRNVLRRDIMKRDPDGSAPARNEEHHEPASVPDANPYASETTASHREAKSGSRLRTAPTAYSKATPERRAAAQDEIEFDDSDWLHEAPEERSRWKWVLPGLGIAATVAASLFFVNQSKWLPLIQRGPDLTLDQAIDLAQQKMDQNSYIFPAGESAIDYYQLILGSDPGNPLAIAGIEQIEQTVSSRIEDSVQSNDLAEANRLLARANNAGLQIDDIPAAGATAFSSPADSSQNTATASGGSTNGISTDGSPSVVAIDTALSPYLKSRINDIETLLNEGKYDEADALFSDTDKYLSDVKLSSSLRSRIDARGQQAENETVTATPSAGSSNVQTDGDDFSLPPLANGEIPALAEISAKSQPATPALNSTNSAATPEQPEKQPEEQPKEQPEDSGAIPPNTDNNGELLASVSGQTISEQPARRGSTGTTSASSNSNPQTAETSTPAVSAPRRSFIAGSGSTARHLNQLRSAIESKNLSQVINVSDNLPGERTAFLETMFSRYDRLDVSIDNIINSTDSVTARLNVSMFNQRSDGSYYSAGKWNGVTLKSNQDNGVWQKIEW